jgi:hypothetical protein
MHDYGGSFVKSLSALAVNHDAATHFIAALGTCIRNADTQNHHRLLHAFNDITEILTMTSQDRYTLLQLTFPDYWTQYRSLAATRKEAPRATG